nr:hypothetical protein [Pseudomonas sp. 25 E 4]
MGVPNVEVAYLWCDRGGNAEGVTTVKDPGTSCADWNFELFDQGAQVLAIANVFIEDGVYLRRGAFADLVSEWVIFVHDGCLDREFSAQEIITIHASAAQYRD